jgi:hypothetical protein
MSVGALSTADGQRTRSNEIQRILAAFGGGVLLMKAPRLIFGLCDTRGQYNHMLSGDFSPVRRQKGIERR